MKLPWAVDMVRFSLDVRIDLGTHEPLWTLYQGDGLADQMLFGTHHLAIFSVLREVIALSIAEIVLEHKQAVVKCSRDTFRIQPISCCQ